jgi:hypothetical protein
VEGDKVKKQNRFFRKPEKDEVRLSGTPKPELPGKAVRTQKTRLSEKLGSKNQKNP